MALFHRSGKYFASFLILNFYSWNFLFRYEETDEFYAEMLTYFGSIRKTISINYSKEPPITTENDLLLEYPLSAIVKKNSTLMILFLTCCTWNKPRNTPRKATSWVYRHWKPDWYPFQRVFALSRYISCVTS